MSDNYLWDKSGEPDPEVQHLEQLLSRLQYKHPPLNLPAAPQRRVSSPALWAIAAAVLVTLAVGVWLGLQHQRKETTQPLVAEKGREANERTRPAESPRPEARIEPKSVPGGKADLALAQPTQRKMIRHTPRRRRQETFETNIATEEEVAKERLMFALHIASAKLNLAQKKVQESSQPVPRS